ncbi:tetratricopeptide repeat protein 23-like [Nematostella vectensis]|uniref:tetratricopeptide repeat protein 23-like n=1 Tax=Nematostella vectensis TaxID=45351 RepID=UPI002076F519|nr:tetratricopeptide repeat protein 23-like [Nematostella vectensis]XP_048581169.1 tetratricopeptide repeat protein 23-like [Nematostella vectensis]
MSRYSAHRSDDDGSSLLSSAGEESLADSGEGRRENARHKPRVMIGGEGEKHSVPAVITIPSVTDPGVAEGRPPRKGPRRGSSSEEFESANEPEDENLGAPGLTPPEVLLKRMRKRARELAAQGAGEESVFDRIRCVALTRIVYGDYHWQLAKAYSKLAYAYFHLRGLAPQALKHAENARDTLLAADNMRQQYRQHYTREDIVPVLQLTYLTMGQAHAALNHFQKAEQNLKKAELVSQEREDMQQGHRNPDRYIKVLMALGKVAMKLNKVGYAMDCLEKGLEAAQKEYGGKGVQLIPIYQSLGHAEQKQGSGLSSKKRSVDMYLHAHGIAQDNYKEDSVQVADSAFMVSLAYLSTGEVEDEEKASEFLHTTIDIYMEHSGPYHKQTVKAQDELCCLLIRQGRLDEALSLLKKLITAKSEIHGDPSNELATAHQLMGSIRLKQAKTEVALKHFMKAYTMLQFVLGNNHRKTKDLRETVELIKRAPGASKVQTSDDKMRERPRFTQVVGRSKPVGSNTTSAWS